MGGGTIPPSPTDRLLATPSRAISSLDSGVSLAFVLERGHSPDLRLVVPLHQHIPVLGNELTTFGFTIVVHSNQSLLTFTGGDSEHSVGIGRGLDSRLALPHDGRRLGCRVVGLSQSLRSVTMGRVHLVSSASRSSHPARFRQSRSLRSSSFESLAHSCRHPSRGSDSQTTSTRHLPVRATREAERDSYR